MEMLRDVPSATRASPPSLHQRIDGEARLAFGRNGIEDLYQRAPCRLLFPDVEHGDSQQAVSITTSGGLTGGDRTHVELRVGRDATGTLSTQAAEKLYRVLPDDPDIAISTRIDVADGGRAEWLSQEAIAFDGARLRRTTTAQLAETASLLATESIVFGRHAYGERFRSGRIHDSWRIWRGKRLVWADAFRIEGDPADPVSPFALGDASAIATLILAAPDAAKHLELARQLVEGCEQGSHAGATCFDGILLLRFLDRDARVLRSRLMRAAKALRAAAFGLPETLPAVWTC